MGRGVNVGNAVGTKRVEVGNGVKVGKSKLNNGVGVGWIPSLGKRIGLGRTVGELRDGIRPMGTAQRQQNASRNKAAKRILPACPCWL